MNNISLLSVVAFSALIVPSLTNAALVNTRIDLKGALSIQGKDSIVLEQRAGRAITLNKGAMEIRAEKVPMGFSLIDPRLVIKQNGQTLAIDVSTDNYHNDDNFTLKAKDSNLNYDLYLRKTETKSAISVREEIQVCTAKEYTYKCGIDMNAAYNCVHGIMDKPGVQKAKNSFITKTTTYKLTLGRNNVQVAEFESSEAKTEKIKSEELEACKQSELFFVRIQLEIPGRAVSERVFFFFEGAD